MPFIEFYPFIARQKISEGCSNFDDGEGLFGEAGDVGKYWDSIDRFPDLPKGHLVGRFEKQMRR